MENQLLTLFAQRRSVRAYTDEPIPEESLKAILQAGLLSPSGRGLRPWELVIVRDRRTLDRLAECRDGAAQMLKGASCAVVVLGDSEKTDVWTEDCSNVMMNMHLMASALGVGSCWIQGRLRTAGGVSTEEIVREILGFPDHLKLEAILSLGMPAAQPEARSLDELPEEKLHWEKF